MFVGEIPNNCCAYTCPLFLKDTCRGVLKMEVPCGTPSHHSFQLEHEINHAASLGYPHDELGNPHTLLDEALHFLLLTEPCPQGSSSWLSIDSDDEGGRAGQWRFAGLRSTEAMLSVLSSNYGGRNPAPVGNY